MITHGNMRAATSRFSDRCNFMLKPLIGQESEQLVAVGRRLHQHRYRDVRDAGGQVPQQAAALDESRVAAGDGRGQFCDGGVTVAVVPQCNAGPGPCGGAATGNRARGPEARSHPPMARAVPAVGKSPRHIGVQAVAGRSALTARFHAGSNTSIGPAYCLGRSGTCSTGFSATPTPVSMPSR